MKTLSATVSLLMLFGMAADGYCDDYDVSNSNGTATGNTTEYVETPKAEEPGTIEKAKQAVEQQIERVRDKIEHKFEMRQQSSGTCSLRG